MEKPSWMKGYLLKRGPRSGSGWNKRFIFLKNNELLYFKEESDSQPIAAIDLAAATQINKSPDSYPKGKKDGAFSLDVREHKEIKTYHFAAASAKDKDLWLGAIVAWRAYTKQQRTQAEAVPALRRELKDANATIEALKEQLRIVQEKHHNPVEDPSQIEQGDLSRQLDLMEEQLEEERSRNRRLTEALEEERFELADLKKQFLMQKKKLAALEGNE